MGSGASTGVVGVPANPRVKYSTSLEKKEKKKVLVDAPVLVDIEHGSVRFRQSQRNKIANKSLRVKVKEQPFEKAPEDQLDKKDHYFYHARLNQYGADASKENEDLFKFYYVVKGPASAHQKKIFYVYGQGWNARDGTKTKPSETIGKGKDYAWSSSVQPNSLYYKLEFDGSENKAVSDETKLLEDLQSSPNKASVQMNMSSDERVAALKARMAIRMLKAVKDICIAFNNRELRDEDIVSDLRSCPEGGKDLDLPENFAVHLTLVN